MYPFPVGESLDARRGAVSKPSGVLLGGDVGARCPHEIRPVCDHARAGGSDDPTPAHHWGTQRPPLDESLPMPLRHGACVDRADGFRLRRSD